MSASALAPARTHAVTTAAFAPAVSPDRLTLWPLDDGKYGLDLTFQGAWGCEDAEQAALHLRGRGLPHVLRPDPDGAWTVRLGPLSSLQVAGALETVVPA